MEGASLDSSANAPVLSRLDRLIEAVVVSGPRGGVAASLIGVLTLGLLGCGLLMATSPPQAPINLFFIPVMGGCFFFRRRGLWVLVPALLLHHLIVLRLGPLPLGAVAVRDLLALLEWVMIGGFTLVTLDKFVALKRHDTRIARDIGMARTLQRALAPPDYDHGRVRILGRIQQSQDIGGDFYYFRPFMEKYVVFCLGDTMGKGIPASMVMAIIMGFFFEWGKKSPSPAIVLSKLNRRLLKLWGEETTWFTTLFYGVFDEESGILTYAAGGHQEGLLLKADGSVEPLLSEGIPIGAFEEGDWVDRQRALEEGDRVLLFTDGLTEARSPEGEWMSAERVLRLLEGHPRHTSQALLERLEAAAREHAGGDLGDDLAMLILEVKRGAVWAPGRDPLHQTESRG